MPEVMEYLDESHREFLVHYIERLERIGQDASDDDKAVGDEVGECRIRSCQ